MAVTFSDTKASTWAARASSPETTASLTWSAGDLVIVVGATEDSTVTLSTPTATGLTFTLVTSYTGGGCNVYIWKATAASSGSGAISSTYTNSRAVGLRAYAISGHNGTGATGAGRAAAGVLTRSLTRTGANSGVVGVLGEFNATNDTAVTASPATNGTVDDAAFTSGAATLYSARWTDQGTAGATSYGIGSFSGTADMSIAVVEILAAAGGTSDTAPQGIGIGQGIAPAARTDASQGAGSGSGAGLTARTAMLPGVGIGQGAAPGEAVTHAASVGVGAGAGISPIAVRAITPLGAGAAAAAGPTARTAVTQSAGVGVGVSPTDSQGGGTSDPAPQGRATGIGASPAARTTSPAGSASGSGNGPTARVTASPGTGIGAPVTASSTTFTATTPGVAAGQGFAPGLMAIAGAGASTGTGIQPAGVRTTAGAGMAAGVGYGPAFTGEVAPGHVEPVATVTGVCEPAASATTLEPHGSLSKLVD